MKKFFILALILVMLIISMGCSVFARMGTSLSYKSINEKEGSIELISGGKVVKDFPLVTITYSDADTNAVMFKTTAKNYYYQEGFLFSY